GGGAGVAVRGGGARRAQPARRIGRCRPQQVAELMSSTGIEAEMGPAGEPRDFAERLPRDRIIALLEHEGWHAKETEFAGRMAQIVELLLHGIADEYQGLSLGLLGLTARVCDDLADLGVAAAAVDPLHEPRQPVGPRNPRRRTAR